MKTKSDRIHGCVGFAIGFESRVNIEDKLRRFGSKMSSGLLFVWGFQNAQPKEHKEWASNQFAIQLVSQLSWVNTEDRLS